MDTGLGGSTISFKVKWELLKGAPQVRWPLNIQHFRTKNVVNKCLDWGHQEYEPKFKRKKNRTNHNVRFRQKNCVHKGRTGAGVCYASGTLGTASAHPGQEELCTRRRT